MHNNVDILYNNVVIVSVIISSTPAATKQLTPKPFLHQWQFCSWANGAFTALMVVVGRVIKKTRSNKEKHFPLPLDRPSGGLWISLG